MRKKKVKDSHGKEENLYGNGAVETLRKKLQGVCTGRREFTRASARRFASGGMVVQSFNSTKKLGVKKP